MTSPDMTDQPDDFEIVLNEKMRASLEVKREQYGARIRKYQERAAGYVRRIIEGRDEFVASITDPSTPLDEKFGPGTEELFRAALRGSSREEIAERIDALAVEVMRESELAVTRDSRYKLAVVTRLLDSGRLSSMEALREVRESEGEDFDLLTLLNAIGVIASYNADEADQVEGGGGFGGATE